MVATTTPTPSPGVIVVEVVDEVEMAGLVEKGWQLTAPDFTAETVRQLVDRRAAAPRAADIVRLAVRDPASGALASKADLLLRGDAAEIDDVLTLPDHRGRGYASAIVLEAVARARRAGADLVFLEAAEDDWPKDLYVRLGFETRGAHPRVLPARRRARDRARAPARPAGRPHDPHLRPYDARRPGRGRPPGTRAGVPLVRRRRRGARGVPWVGRLGAPDLGRLLLERGATTIRHAHWLARDLVPTRRTRPGPR